MLTADRVVRKISRMANAPGDAGSIDALHEQSAELILHARRLQQEFVQLRETSKLLRKESMQPAGRLQGLARQPQTVDLAITVIESLGSVP